MKKYMLLTMVVMAMVCGSAYAAGTSHEHGASGTAAVNDVTLLIDNYCSVQIGTAALHMTNPETGTANADATCAVTANFAAIITPTVATFTDYTLTEKPDWVWTPTITAASHAHVAAGVLSSDVVNVALSGVALTDAPILTTPVKVAVLTVTITADV
jgi:hypothetical protein